MLLDRLVCGINDDRIQKRLLSEPELAFQNAFDLHVAQAMEMADKGTHDLQNISQSPQSDVNILQQNHGQSLKKTSRSNAAHVQSTRPFCPATGSQCYHCGGKHTASVCWAKEATCHYCHKKGHIVRVCRTKQNRRNPGKLSVKTNLVQTVTESNEDYSLITLGSTHSPPLRVEVYLDQQPVTMQVDTGAAVSVISYNVFQSIWDSLPSLMKSDVKLQSYTWEQIGVIGCFTTSDSYQGQKKDLPLLVVVGSGPSLLGRN